MQIPKDHAMLLDIQYVRANRQLQQQDYLYIIWKDLETGKKHLNVIPEPQVEIYFEKPEYRNHTYNKNYAPIDTLMKYTVKHKDIIYAIADDMGDVGRQKIQACFDTRNYKGLNEFLIYPYVYGADYDVRVWYRYKWLSTFDNDLPKPLTKGYLDIEVDSLEAVGFPTPEKNPIDLVTLIDGSTSTSYTFVLIGVDYVDKDLTGMTPNEVQEEIKKKKLYDHRMDEQSYYFNHIDEVEKAAHEMFDENYPDMNYKFFFYHDEKEMIVHLFQLIHQLQLDFIEIWNMPFDIPFIMDRLRRLGMEPEDVMCHPDFPAKQCFFKKDTINFAVKNKSDYFACSDYTIWQDQMRNYAAIRKGKSELRRNSLNYIAEKEIGDVKLDYSEEGNIKTLSYRNFLLYILYNIKDVLLQKGIEEATSDLETVYLTSYANITPYESIFKQTVKLRNVQYKFFLAQGLVPGENVNGFLYNNADTKESDDSDEDDDDETTFEGALVGDPTLIDNFGEKLFGNPTNSIFNFSIDFDMSSFYPSTIRVMNIDPSTLIFKMIVPANQYDVRGGQLPYHGITDSQMNKKNSDSFVDDVSKEIMDNFQTGNILETGYKWLNLPSVTEVYNVLKKKYKKSEE